MWYIFAFLSMYSIFVVLHPECRTLLVSRNCLTKITIQKLKGVLLYVDLISDPLKIKSKSIVFSCHILVNRHIIFQLKLSKDFMTGISSRNHTVKVAINDRPTDRQSHLNQILWYAPIHVGQYEKIWRNLIKSPFHCAWLTGY